MKIKNPLISTAFGMLLCLWLFLSAEAQIKKVASVEGITQYSLENYLVMAF